MSFIILVALFMALLDQKDRRAYLLGLKIAGDFGATIAVPVVLLVLLGRYLDSRYGGIWFTILGFILSALVSGAIIYRKAKAYGGEYQNLNGNKAGENISDRR